LRLGVAIDLLEAGGVARERLTRLAGSQFRIVGSDQRGFALLAARFPEPPAGEMFLSLARGELRALRLLADFAAALEWQERDLQAYEPQPPESGVPRHGPCPPAGKECFDGGSDDWDRSAQGLAHGGGDQRGAGAAG
jgi:hypothetical protein